jgi:glucose-6-phosphate dehydrogenase assembly protein OpcA
MAAAVVQRAWRESTPEAVEDDLAALWREVAAGEHVARAVMANLVVFRFRERWTTYADDVAQRGDRAIESVIGLHPSRAIVIEHERGDHSAQAPAGAGVGISIFGSASSRYGVERIVVRSACAEVSLPSIVRRFLRGDRPTSVWWTEDLSRDVPSQVLVELTRQLVYDSRDWSDVPAGFRAVAALAASDRVDLADLNWRRLAPVRRALVNAVATLSGSRSPLRVAIAHRTGEAALAWLLGGWLAAQLGLDRHNWPSIEESRVAPEVLTVTVEDGSGEIVTTLENHRVVVTTHAHPPMIVPAPAEPPADAIAAELRCLARDAALRQALAAIGRHAVQS